MAGVEAGFVAAGMPADVAGRLLAEYAEAKRRLYLGDHQPTAVEGGRFAEAALRVIEHALFGKHTPFTKNLAQFNAQRLAQFESATSPFDSLRIHVPRALYSVYAVRNKRDAAHLNDGISANLQDSTYVVGVLDWIVAEFVRIYHQVTPGEAQAIIDDLIEREVPIVEEIDGQSVLNRPSMRAADVVLVFLYREGKDKGLSVAELMEHMRAGDRSNLMKVVKRLDADGRVLIHPRTNRLHITSPGLRDVEARRLLG